MNCFDTPGSEPCGDVRVPGECLGAGPHAGVLATIFALATRLGGFYQEGPAVFETP